MVIKTETKGAVIVCRIDGKIDINSIQDMNKLFGDLAAKKTPAILMNFLKVTYLDSSGMGALVEIMKGVKAYGGKLKITNIPPKIKMLFVITKLAKLFDIVDEEETALTGF
jgi:anti-sigma B factor antagonist